MQRRASRTRSAQLDALLSPTVALKKQNVLLITAGFKGCNRMGGITTAFTRLAMLLRDAGFSVTILYTTKHCTLTEDDWEKQAAAVKGEGMT